ncbi:MAG: hypothetical protein ABR559_04810 [Gemmatimonadota bacterium]
MLVWAGLMALAWATVPGETFAQDDTPSIDIAILNQGKPIADVEVFAVLNAGKPVEVGTTAAGGQLAVDLSALDFDKGETVEVWVKRCVDGKVQVFLARPGAVEEGRSVCDSNAREGEDCPTCEKIGAFVWGEGSVTIDVGAGTVGMVPTGAAIGSAPPQLFGIGAGPSWFTKLEDIACDQQAIGACDVPSTALTLQFLYEWPLLSALVLGLQGTWSPVGEITQEYANHPDGARSSTLDLDVYTAGAYAGWRPGLYHDGRLGFLLGLGLAYAWNRAAIETLYSGAPASSEDRSEGGLRGLGLLGADWYFSPRAGLRLEGGYLSGGSDDADTNFHLGLKFLWLLSQWNDRRAE